MVDGQRQDLRLEAIMQSAGLGEAASDWAVAFGERLVADNLLDAGSVDRARRAAIKTGERFDHVLAKLGLLSEAMLLQALGEYLGVKIAVARDVPARPVLPEIIRPKFVKTRRVLPLAVQGGALAVAVVDALDDEPVRAIAYLTGHTVKKLLIAQGDFNRAAHTLYPDQRGEDSHDSRREEASEWDVQRLRDLANEAPIIRMVNEIIGDAVEATASDIHVEPGVDEVAVRYRIDGQLRQVQALPAGLRAAVTSRIKIMAKLDIAERRMPQDGRLKVPVRGVDIDFRISTLPTAHGEGVVMRILDRSQVELDFTRLGFFADHIRTLEFLMDQPNGIFLVTGPTGSGKTTTLYTGLKRVSRPNMKVLTVEDPIEYQMPGVSQIQVHPQIGLDFPHVLRSILRQDPDIIMIGEIRDLETARIAVQASLTGHLVFSTLHTNSAASTITRLVDMGVESYLLASTVNGILAQRLVRRLCVNCAAPHHNASAWRLRIAGELSGQHPAREARVLTAVGCTVCGGTGFSGRVAIAEILVMDEEKRAAILAGAVESELAAAAHKSGMRTMYEDGLAKVWEGETTIEEVLRITRTGL